MLLPSCCYCIFFVTLDGDHAASLRPADQAECLQGHCRRNPPSVGRFRGEDEDLEYDYGQWPLVLSSDWCGAFEPCRQKRAPVTHRRATFAPDAPYGCPPCRGPAAPPARDVGQPGAKAMVPYRPKAP